MSISRPYISISTKTNGNENQKNKKHIDWNQNNTKKSICCSTSMHVSYDDCGFKYFSTIVSAAGHFVCFSNDCCCQYETKLSTKHIYLKWKLPRLSCQMHTNQCCQELYKPNEQQKRQSWNSSRQHVSAKINRKIRTSVQWNGMRPSLAFSFLPLLDECSELNERKIT